MRVCTDASNINGRMVAGEASLSQFLFGEGGGGTEESFFIATNTEFRKLTIKIARKLPVLKQRTHVWPNEGREKIDIFQ